MSEDSEIEDRVGKATVHSVRPGEDCSEPRGWAMGEDRQSRRYPPRAWRGFPLMERSWAMDVFAAVSPDEADAIQRLITLNVVSSRAWGRIAERAADVDLQWRCAALAQWRDECANELQELLCEAGEHAACLYVSPRRVGVNGAPGILEGAALPKALSDLVEQDACVEREYQELLGKVSAMFDEVITRQWKRSRELFKEDGPLWPAHSQRGQRV